MNRFLIIGRVGAVAVSSIAVVFDLKIQQNQRATLILLTEFILYNVIAGAGSMTAWRRGGTPLLALIVADILETNFAMAVTGGYDSPYFAIFLFAMAETSLIFEWKISATIIVVLNSVQAIFSSIRVTTLETSVPSSFAEGRLPRLMVVGILFIIFAESIRREEIARKTAVMHSLRTAALNSVFTQMEQAHLSVTKVFSAVLAAAASLDSVLFCVIFRKSAPDATWKVAASSRQETCPTGWSLGDVEEVTRNGSETPHPHTLRREAMNTAFRSCLPAECRRVVLFPMPTYSQTEAGMLAVGMTADQPLEENDEIFLQSLSMQAQLSIHNALLSREQVRQIEKLRRFEQMQDTFFSSAAHELKTPLTVIDLLTSTLKMTVPEPTSEQEEMFTTIEHNIRRLRTQASNMVGAARLTVADVALNRRLIDPKHIASRAVESMATIFKDKHVAVSLVPATQWPRIMADADRLAEVLTNLLSNAGKFAPDNSVVTVRFQQTSTQTVISVCDQGPGIPESEQQKIFERFYTAEDAGSRAGTGLGLYIVRELVLLHGGTVWLETRTGVNCICFSLPSVEAEEGGDGE